jgi:hypothetical protein
MEDSLRETLCSFKKIGKNEQEGKRGIKYEEVNRKKQYCPFLSLIRPA